MALAKCRCILYTCRLNAARDSAVGSGGGQCAISMQLQPYAAALGLNCWLARLKWRQMEDFHDHPRTRCSQWQPVLFKLEYWVILTEFAPKFLHLPRRQNSVAPNPNPDIDRWSCGRWRYGGEHRARTPRYRTMFHLKVRWEAFRRWA